uniref:Cobalt/nickel ABC transporter ATP-binding protein n=1 Tax=Caldiarchaeum subterraneum TaxID=311458 RepID=E6NB72_CALS0|nr:cobalt/nickel ABC transporter ATP-binding protein [Candidatus Caldarchaeum subterraneum]
MFIEQERSSQEHYDIVLDNVTWTYSGSSKPAVKNINLRVKKGEILVITGPSGSGKTTLSRILNGLIPHFYRGEISGEAYVGGLRVRDYDVSILAAKVGLVFDNPANQLFTSTVVEEIAFGPENYCLPRDEIWRRVSYALNFSRLSGLENKSPYLLSGGQQQACALAAIIAMMPDILVLDEPTSNLDPEGTELVFNRIREVAEEQHKTMVIIEHKLDYVLPLADHLAVMNNGEIVAYGKPLDVLDQVELMEELDLQIPHATEIAYWFKRRGHNIHNMPVTIEEGVTFLRKILNPDNKKPLSPNFRDKDKRSVLSEVAIKCEDVWYQYKDGTMALKGVNIDAIYHGEFVGFIGKNGSGKTTTAKMLNGLYKPTSGRVIVYGRDTRGLSVKELAKDVAYVAQMPDDQLFAKTVREELAFGPRNLGVPEDEVMRRVEHVAEELELKPYLDVSPFSLSQGLKQRVVVGSAITMNPRVLVVDEPTTGQDFARAAAMMELAKKLNERGTTVVVISHNMDLIAAYCHRVFVFYDGKVIDKGTPREVFQREEVLSRTSLKPPQVTLISRRLKDLGVPDDIITVSEMIEYLEKVVS